MDYDLIREQVKKELGNNQRQLFKSFCVTHSRRGVAWSVHRAQFKSGEEVVVEGPVSGRGQKR